MKFTFLVNFFMRLNPIVFMHIKFFEDGEQSFDVQHNAFSFFLSPSRSLALAHSFPNNILQTCFLSIKFGIHCTVIMSIFIQMLIPFVGGRVYMFFILNMVRFSISLSLNSKRMKNKSLISIECSEKFNTNSVFYRFFGVRFSEGNIPKSVELNFLS